MKLIKNVLKLVETISYNSSHIGLDGLYGMVEEKGQQARTSHSSYIEIYGQILDNLINSYKT